MAEWPIVAATNLEGTAALWLQSNSYAIDWTQLTWPSFKEALIAAIVPADLSLRNVDSLLDCKQGTRSVDDYA